MLEYEITPDLQQAVLSSGIGEELAERLLSQDTISHTNLSIFYRTYKPTSSLLELVRLTKTRVKGETEAPRPKSDAFVREMERLRLRAKEEEYQKLVNPAPSMATLYEARFDDEKALPPAQAAKELRSHVTTIFNVILSVGSVVYAVWYWTNSSWGLPDSQRVLLCLFFGILVLVAEVVVYLGYLNKIEEARVTERKKKEVKKVVGRI